MVQNKHKSTINRVKSLINKAYKDKDMVFHFMVQMKESGMYMDLVFENIFNISKDLRYVEKDNVYLFYFILRYLKCGQWVMLHMKVLVIRIRQRMR